MAEQKSFLTLPLSSIRRSIKDIDDSYRNPWDIYAELAQNAVDAIRRMQKKHHEKGRIELKIDARRQTIEITDNGCGIASQDLPHLLQLFSSGKDKDPDLVGEKGVGLKFAFFQSTYFKIISSDGQSGGWAEIKDARLWKKGTNNEELKLNFEEQNDLPRGTTIILNGVEIEKQKDDEQSTSIFNLSFNQLKYVLRNATYFGDVTSIWNPAADQISIDLLYSDLNGQQYHEILENKFFLPIEGYNDATIVDIDEFEAWSQSTDRNDSDKRNKLQKKILVLKGEHMHRSRKINYWACFLPARKHWDEINRKHNLLPQGLDNIDEWSQNNSYCIFSPGIYTATKGMPTGISIAKPNTGNAGYWQNFFMIFQDDTLTFDIGRKSIHGKTQAIYQQLAKTIFNRITKYVVRYTSATGDNLDDSDPFSLIDVIQDVKSKIDLNSTKVKFKKSPYDQEASVAAIFYELIGNQTINDIEPIYSCYKHKYDLYANFIPENQKARFYIIEFKSRLLNIVKDFPDARKVFNQMNCIVCWNVTDEDIQCLSDFGINCDEISGSELSTPNHPSSVTHYLTIPNCDPVYVIDLKKIVL